MRHKTTDAAERALDAINALCRGDNAAATPTDASREVVDVDDAADAADDVDDAAVATTSDDVVVDDAAAATTDASDDVDNGASAPAQVDDDAGRDCTPMSDNEKIIRVRVLPHPCCVAVTHFVCALFHRTFCKR